MGGQLRNSASDVARRGPERPAPGGEQVTFETSHLASAGDVSVENTGGIAVSWKRAADGNYTMSFRAPYEGYYELVFDFERAPLRVPLLWVPGDVPPPVHFPDGVLPPSPVPSLSSSP